MDETQQSVLAIAGRIRMSSAALYMFDLLRGLHEEGCRVALICRNRPGERGRWRAPFPAFRWRDVAAGPVALCERERFEKTLHIPWPDVLHLFGKGLGRSGRRFVKHAGRPVIFTPDFTPGQSPEAARMQSVCDNVIALSQSMRETLVNRVKIPRSKVRVVLPGIDLESYPLLPPDMESRTPVVGTVAPLETDRGQRLFLQSARRLLDAGRHVEFMIGGDGPREMALRKHARQLGLEQSVTFVTNLTDYRSVTAALDVFVRPAAIGTIGYTVLEAMAMCKPVVACSTAGIVEIVEDCETGFLVPKKDPDALAEAIGNLLDAPSLARRMGAAGRARVGEFFGMDRLVARTMQLYGEAAARPEETVVRR